MAISSFFMKKFLFLSFSLFLLPVFSGSTSVKNMLNLADLDSANKCTWVQAALQEIEEPPTNFAVHGRDLMSGIPKEIIVTYKEIARALDQTISQIEQAVLAALGQTPPELSADIYNTGIYLTGGGSMLRGLDKRISLKTKLPVYVAEDPLRAVARGTGIALKNTENFPFLIR